MQKPLPHLSWAVWTDDRPQYAIAAAAGLTESRLSRILTGRLFATPEERKRLATTLNVAEAVLFDPDGYTVVGAR